MGELVLKRIISTQKDPHRKWVPNYEGPYVVKKVFSGGALILTNMEREDLTYVVNSDAIKKYYV